MPIKRNMSRVSVVVVCAALVGLAAAQIPVPTTCANATVSVNGSQVQQWVWQLCDANNSITCPLK